AGRRRPVHAPVRGDLRLDDRAHRSRIGHSGSLRSPHPADIRPQRRPRRQDAPMTGAAGNGSRFAWRLAAVAAGGVVLRIVYDVVVIHRLHLGIDSTWYYLEAGVLRRQHAYADPSVFVVHRSPTA